MKNQTREEKGSLLIITIIMVAFLGALAIAVINPVSGSRKVTDVMYNRKMARIVAESAAERVKAIMCQDNLPDPAWPEGTSVCIQSVLGTGWIPKTLTENGGVDEARVTYPTIDMTDNAGAPKFDTTVTDGNYPQIVSGVGNNVSYIVFTSTDTDEFGHAQSYVSATCNGEVVNMKVNFKKSPEEKTEEIPNPWVQPSVKAAFGKDGLTMGGQKFTDSYDSRVGGYGGANVNDYGDVGSDAELEASGGMVNGDAYVLDEDDFTGSETNVSKKVIDHDDPTQMPAVIFPDTLSDWNPTTYATLAASGVPTYGPGDIHVTGDLTLSGNATGKIKIQAPARIIIDGDFQSTGHGLIEILPGPNQDENGYPLDDVKIFNRVDENDPPEFDENGDLVPDVLISGNGMSNPGVPSNLRFYTNAPNVKISGSSEFRGVIYAPDANIKATGDGNVKGALIGNTIEIFGNPWNGIHFDEALMYADFDDDIDDVTIITGIEYTGPYQTISTQILD